MRYSHEIKKLSNQYNRRTFIKAGALVVPATTYQVVHSPSVVAHPHPMEELIVGNRVFAHDNRIYGVTAHSFPTARLAEEVIRGLENNIAAADLQEAIGRLLYAPESDHSDPRNISNIPEPLWADAKSVSGELGDQGWIQDDSIYRWVQINPPFILFTPAVRAVGILFLGSFVNGFGDEAGRDVWRWLKSWVSERIQQ